jgi:NADPH:quinone reductase-like Zn-dependent oxidoreductase
MKAVAFFEHGEIDRLQVVELPDPAVGPGEVRVRVKAVALNRLDLWVRTGWKGLELPLPHILGSDIAGVVDSVGDTVQGISAGDEVILGPGTSCGVCESCLMGQDHRCRRYAILGEHRSGGYAELITVPARNVFKKPKQLSFEEAACLPLVYTTAWGMLVERARVKPGDIVLVHAAGSGVGSASIQVAKLFGATVIATASTDDKLERAKHLGLDHGINYAREDVRARVKELTHKRGCDIVIEHTGGDTFGASLLCLATGGILVTCGATAKPKVEIDIRHLFTRHLTIAGHTMGALASMIPILANAEAGKLRPVLDRVMALEDARKAHEVLLDRAQFGKVVLRP